MKRILIAVAVLLSIPILLFGVIVLFVGVWITIKGVDVPPPDTSDLVPKRVQVSDDENAHTYFVAATDALDLSEDSDRLYDILDGTVQDDEFVHDLIAKNADSLKLIERGLACRTCQSPEVTSFDDLSPYAGEFRCLVRIMALRAMRQRHNGEYAQSANSCIQLLRLGAMPDSLCALVPKFIGCVPTDPFDGKPFRYSKEKCVVYSVATDLKDSGGSTKSSYDEPEPNPHRKHWYGEDFVFAIK